MKDLKKLINQSELSREITGGDRGAIRIPKKVPVRYINALDKLFNEDLPKWWKEIKKEI